MFSHKKMPGLLLLFFLCSQVWSANHDWVFPWVANRAERWSTRLMIQNHGFSEAAVTLRAVRANGDEETVNLTIPAASAVSHSAGDLFATLGSGDGYAVFMTSDEPGLTGRYLVFSNFAPEANSPAAGEALEMSDASTMLGTAFMTADPDAFAASVIVNTSDVAATVDVSATMVNRNKKVLRKTTTLTVEPGRPAVLISQELFPGEMGDLNMMIQSDANMLGHAFFFNAAGEPGIARAEDLTIIAPKLEPLTDADYEDTTDEKVALGKMLFWDKILSGNQNISCATCHHTFAGTGDGLSLPVGAGGTGFGITRLTDAPDVHERVPRNAPDVFNVGLKVGDFMFHDGRVADNGDGTFTTPAGDELLPGLDSVVAAQAMFPPTSNAEMAGPVGSNEVSSAANNTELWAALTARLMAIDEYQDLFRAAYPELSVPEDITFAHAANAIAAYEIATFRADNSAFDRFLRGERDAMSRQEKRGMKLFYGKASCSGCHVGTVQSDFQFHSLAIPPVGPGKGDGIEGRDDFGRFRETGDDFDMYRFRTPSLRNVAITGPWAHNGAYNTLEAMVRHHLNPVDSLRNYDPSQAVLISRDDLNAEDWVALSDTATMDAIAATAEIQSIDLNEAEIQDILAFLHSLTDPASLDMRNAVPLRVPSGLPVAD